MPKRKIQRPKEISGLILRIGGGGGALSKKLKGFQRIGRRKANEQKKIDDVRNYDLMIERLSQNDIVVSKSAFLTSVGHHDVLCNLKTFYWICLQLGLPWIC